MLFPGTQVHTRTCKSYGRAAESSCKEPRNAHPPWALLSPLPFPPGRFGCWVDLLLLFSASPSPLLGFCCCWGHRCPRWSREGAQGVCIFNGVIDLPTSCLGGGENLCTPANRLQGGKTFSMSNQEGDADPSCSQRWLWGHLGSLYHPKPKQFLINESWLFNLVQVLFKIVPAD